MKRPLTPLTHSYLFLRRTSSFYNLDDDQSLLLPVGYFYTVCRSSIKRFEKAYCFCKTNTFPPPASVDAVGQVLGGDFDINRRSVCFVAVRHETYVQVCVCVCVCQNLMQCVMQLICCSQKGTLGSQWHKRWLVFDSDSLRYYSNNKVCSLCSQWIFLLTTLYNSLAVVFKLLSYF